jgi:hypothetical protein
VEAKLKLYRPEIVVRPAVDRFRVLDFFQPQPTIPYCRSVSCAPSACGCCWSRPIPF